MLQKKSGQNISSNPQICANLLIKSAPAEASTTVANSRQKFSASLVEKIDHCAIFSAILELNFLGFVPEKTKNEIKIKFGCTFFSMSVFFSYAAEILASLHLSKDQNRFCRVLGNRKNDICKQLLENRQDLKS
jgi:hypothetical protein